MWSTVTYPLRSLPFDETKTSRLPCLYVLIDVSQPQSRCDILSLKLFCFDQCPDEAVWAIPTRFQLWRGLFTNSHRCILDWERMSPLASRNISSCRKTRIPKMYAAIQHCSFLNRHYFNRLKVYCVRGRWNPARFKDHSLGKHTETSTCVCMPCRWLLTMFEHPHERLKYPQGGCWIAFVSVLSCRSHASSARWRIVVYAMISDFYTKQNDWLSQNATTMIPRHLLQLP